MLVSRCPGCPDGPGCDELEISGIAPPVLKKDYLHPGIQHLFHLLIQHRRKHALHQFLPPVFRNIRQNQLRQFFCFSAFS